ncbi:hypothetical protein FHS01_001399 [Longimicrobium terrae]|uniref:Uncharacterized protein n=1 Tax=Longimicrobium terrae TaxID=1639882 RepID=A0A841GLX5_9BACT|nr:hypothetical protein [Longimicrobium terrae]MBB4635387.1 hypothetical protein [Longimicrobium terrae]MBB6069781.1 hypothetical protein [Longimicrobium terrae]
MPYTAEKPPLRRSIEELRATIPGWGVDLDPADRPGIPNQRFAPEITGAHWDFPERQPELWPRERSPEHKFLTPVFGTSCPPKGLSGAIRKFAYRYSEGRSSHWLLLVAADRVDVFESRITSALSGRPDNVVAETGVQYEWKRHGVRSRMGRHRADVKHQWIDPLITMAPYLLAGYGAYSLGRAIVRGVNGTSGGVRVPDYLAGATSGASGAGTRREHTVSYPAGAGAGRDQADVYSATASNAAHFRDRPAAHSTGAPPRREAPAPRRDPRDPGY